MNAAGSSEVFEPRRCGCVTKLSHECRPAALTHKRKTKKTGGVAHHTLSWSPSKSCRNVACVPVVPFTPLIGRSSMHRSRAATSSTKSCARNRKNTRRERMKVYNHGGNRAATAAAAAAALTKGGFARRCGRSIDHSCSSRHGGPSCQKAFRASGSNSIQQDREDPASCPHATPLCIHNGKPQWVYPRTRSDRAPPPRPLCRTRAPQRHRFQPVPAPLTPMSTPMSTPASRGWRASPRW